MLITGEEGTVPLCVPEASLRLSYSASNTFSPLVLGDVRAVISGQAYSPG
jgi:hypothetical protein